MAGAGREKSIAAAVETRHVRLVISKDVLIFGKSSSVIKKASVEEVVQKIELMGDFRGQHILGIIAVHIVELVLGGQPSIRKPGNYTIASACCGLDAHKGSTKPTLVHIAARGIGLHPGDRIW